MKKVVTVLLFVVLCVTSVPSHAVATTYGGGSGSFSGVLESIRMMLTSFQNRLSTLAPQTQVAQVGGVPYTLPSAGQAVSIGSNDAMDVVPTGEGWTAVAWEYSLFNSYGGGTFVPTYSSLGAYVLAGTGGHNHPDNNGAAVFDFSTGSWTRLDNANGVSRPTNSPWAYSVSQSNGSPYFEVTGTQVPLPVHPYAQLTYIPQGSKGSVGYVTRAASGIESAMSGASHRFDLGTRTWSRLTNELSSRNGVEGDSVYDSGRNRVWIIPIQAHNYMDVEYLDLGSMTLKKSASMGGWPSGALGTGYNRAFMHDTYLLRYGGGGSSLWLFDPDNASAGWMQLTVSGTLPNGSNRWARYSDGKYYAFDGDASSNTITRITPPANPKTGTWVVDTVTLTGATLPARVGTTNHYTRLFYVPAIDSIAWVPGGTNSVIIFKPGTGSGTTPTPTNGTCGSSSGGTFSSDPTTNLCTLGTPSSVTTNTSTYTWSCAGANGGTTASCSATRTTTTPAPTVTLSASPSSITSEQSSTLTWSSTNSTSCTARGGWTGTKTTSGTFTTPALTTTTTYTLSCTGGGGSATSSTSVIVSSTPPPSGSTITTVSLTSPQSGTVPFTIGHAFKEGDVPNGQYVASSDTSSFQAVVKNRWPDGSVKFAVLSGLATVVANTPDTITLIRTSTAPVGSNLTTANLKGTGATASISYGSYGTVSWSNTDWDAPFQTLTQGPYMSSWTYRKPIGSDAHLVAWLEVRAYQNGNVEVVPWIENGYLKVANPGERSGTATFTLGGSQRFSQSLTLLNHQRTYLGSGTVLSHWLGTDPQVTPTHNVDYLMATKLVPNYIAKTPSNSPLFARIPTSYTPLAQGSYPAGMGTAGYHHSIGLLPEWDVAFLTTNADPRAYRGVLIQAYLAGRYGTHYRDETTQRPPRFTSYPNLVLNGSSGVSDTGASTPGQYTPTASGAVPPTYKNTHHPSMGYLAYLITGRNYFLEETQFVATTNFLKNTDWQRNNTEGVFRTDVGANTTRGAAWSIRTLAQAAALTPDTDVLRSEFVTSLTKNIEYYHTRYLGQSHNQTGFVTPYSDYEAGDPWQSAIWMEDFVVQVFGYLRDLEAYTPTAESKLNAFNAWKSRTVVGRLGGVDADQFSYRHAGQYTVFYSPSASANWNNGSGPWYQSWGEIARAMNIPDDGTPGGALVDGYPTDATSYIGNMHPAIAYAVEQGQPGAADAWTRLSTASNYSTLRNDFNNNPVWGVYPRSVAQSLPNQPSVTLSASSLNVTSGQSATLTWSSTNSISCTASGGWMGTKTTSGTQSVSPTANTTYTLTCTGAGGSASQSVTVTVSSVPQPTLTLTAFPTSVTQGVSTVLNWSTTDASSCTASGGWTGAKTVTGSQSVTPSANTTYTLTCTGSGGTATQSVTVTVTQVPTVTLSASPSSITTGQSSTLSWSTTNSTSCTARGGWTGSKATSGTQSVSPTANTTYTLTCTGAGGSAEQSTTVTVSALPSPSVTITASPSSIAYGGTSVIAWSSTNSTSCTVTNGSSGTSGSFVTPSLTANTTYTATCTGSGGSASQSATVSVAPQPTDTTPPTVSLTAPASGATVSGSAVVVSGTASDNVGVAGVQFTVDGQNLGGEDTVAPYEITWNTTLLPDGTYTLGAKARDAKGNTGNAATRSITVKNTVPVDTTPPTITITEPGGGTTIAGSAVALSANATDNVGVSSVQFMVDGVNYGSPDTTFPYGVLMNTTALSNGSHTISAVANDAKGNTGTAQAVTVTVYNAATVVDVVSPTTPQTLTVTTRGANSLSLSWSLSADNVGVTGYHVERCEGSACTSFKEIGVSTGNGYTDGSLASGATYRYRVRATDAAKNLSGYSEIKAGTTEKQSSGGGGGGGGKKKKKDAETIRKSGLITPDTRTNLLLSAQAVLQTLGSGGGSGGAKRVFTQSLYVGLISPEVRMLQEFLKEKGLLQADGVTGFYGQMTMSAVKRYQCEKGIACSGTPESNGYGLVGAKTRSFLNMEGGTTPIAPTYTPTPTTPTLPVTTTGGTITAFLYKGINHPQVATLQQFLMKSGYLTPDTPTTFFGNLTESALKRFQCEKLSVCSGTPDITGYGATGPRTRALVK